MTKEHRKFNGVFFERSQLQIVTMSPPLLHPFAITIIMNYLKIWKRAKMFNGLWLIRTLKELKQNHIEREMKITNLINTRVNVIPLYMFSLKLNILFYINELINLKFKLQAENNKKVNFNFFFIFIRWFKNGQPKCRFKYH